MYYSTYYILIKVEYHILERNSLNRRNNFVTNSYIVLLSIILSLFVKKGQWRGGGSCIDSWGDACCGVWVKRQERVKERMNCRIKAYHKESMIELKTINKQIKYEWRNEWINK